MIYHYSIGKEILKLLISNTSKLDVIILRLNELHRDTSSINKTIFSSKQTNLTRIKIWENKLILNKILRKDWYKNSSKAFTEVIEIDLKN
jgi:hypothetical protein